jgi:ketosteroid isomerase-like protein
MSDKSTIVREMYAALNRNDIPAALSSFDPQVVRIEWEGTPRERTYRGYAEVLAHFHEGRGNWAEGACEPERLQVVGDKVIVFVYVKVRLKNKTEWNEGRVADVFTFRNDKVIEFRSFFESEDALKWVGV